MTESTREPERCLYPPAPTLKGCGAAISEDLSSLLWGIGAGCRGLLFVATRPDLLTACLPGTIATVGLSLALALALWLPCLLLRLPPFRYDVSWRSLLLLASLMILKVSQSLVPHLSGTVFFAAFAEATKNGKPAGRRRLEALEARPQLRGLLAQLRHVST